MKLTNKSIKAFVYDGGWDVRWDDAVPGLGVRIYPSGKKAFVLSYRAGGRKRMMVLGRYGADLTLDQAREKARKERVRVRDGTDPLEEKKRAAKGSTFGDLLDAYLDRHARVHKATWRDDERRLNLHIPRSWRGRRADNVTRADIAALHARVGTVAPYQANRLLANLHLIFRLGQVWAFIPEGSPNPASGIKRFKEEKRKRWAKPEEVAAIARAIDREPNIYIRAVLWLYLLTGARKSELLSARRDQVEWGRRQLRLPSTKAGEEQYVVLNAQALAILQALPVLEGNPHLFPGRRPGQPLVNISKAWNLVRDRATVIMWADDDTGGSHLVAELAKELNREPTAGEVEARAAERRHEMRGNIRNLRIHDLRRSVGSWMSQSGVDLNVIKDGLRHADLGTTLIYARLGEDAAREAFEQHGRRIMEATGRAGPTIVSTSGEEKGK